MKAANSINLAKLGILQAVYSAGERTSGGRNAGGDSVSYHTITKALPMEIIHQSLISQLVTFLPVGTWTSGSLRGPEYIENPYRSTPEITIKALEQLLVDGCIQEQNIRGKKHYAVLQPGIDLWQSLRAQNIETLRAQNDIVETFTLDEIRRLVTGALDGGTSDAVQKVMVAFAQRFSRESPAVEPTEAVVRSM